jgi:hypothetical protein
MIWLQDSAFSTWLRESSWALFALLILHTIALGFVVGTAVLIALRAFGFGTRLAAALLLKFDPILKCSLIAAVVTGSLLVVSYPAKALTNPVFYLKMVLLLAAWTVTRAMLARLACADHEGLPQVQLRRLAFAFLALWVSALTAGKFLPYTNTVLLLY